MRDVLSDPLIKADPYPFYARLRAESPVHPIKTRRGRTTWMVTRFHDVITVLSDDRFANDRRSVDSSVGRFDSWCPAFVTPLFRTILHRDPPGHARLRTLAGHAVSSAIIETAQRRVVELTADLLRRARGQRIIDLVSDYAQQIPLAIIADILGVPERDRLRVHRWIMILLTANRSWRRAPATLFGAWRLMHYIRDTAHHRGLGADGDFIATMSRARHGGRIDGEELLGLVYFLILAGQTTTVDLISSGMLALLEHPAELERLRHNPGLIKPAVEELLRYCSPTEVAAKRHARSPVRIADVTIRQGDIVYAVIASANRDERQFVDADRVDITRAPNRHIAFGIGRHFCVGAQLARLETQIAISTLLQGTSELRLAVEKPALRWRSGRLLRGLTSLPVCISIESE